MVRRGRVVKALDSILNPPLGLQPDAPDVGDERLEPGDRVLLYTDGVIEALRRLNLAILSHQEGMLQDDATTLMVEWSSADARQMHP